MRADGDGIGVIRHLAVIMDGNGRWAKRRGQPREWGHRAGSDNLHALCRLAIERNIPYVTVYAFSTENWRRPEKEVRQLMRMVPHYFKKYDREMAREGVRIRFMGDREGLSPSLIELIDDAETTSRDRTTLQLIIAFNYGGHREMVHAARRAADAVAQGALDPEQLDERTFARYLYLPDVPPPDLMIRTGGERRLSNFLLWELAYTELYFEECLWPDFGAEELDRAIEDFTRRQRRFGDV